VSTEITMDKQQIAEVYKSALIKQMGLTEVDALLLARKGAELGVDTLASLSGIYVVKGRPFLSADLKRGLILRHGHTFRIAEWSAQKIVVQTARRGDELTTIEYTMQEAAHSGRTSSATWKQHPRRMLLHAVTHHIAAAMFADLFLGMGGEPEDSDNIDYRPQAASETLLESRAEEPQARSITLADFKTRPGHRASVIAENISNENEGWGE